MEPERSARPMPPARAENVVPDVKAARVEAAATNAQLRAMQALTDTALSHLALDDLLPELLGRVTAVMGVDTVGISLLDADGRTLTLRAARGLGEEDVGRVRIPVGQGFLGRVTASREPLILDADALSAADFEGLHPILWERLRAVAGVPLLVEDQAEGRRAEGRLVGVLAVGSAAPHRFTEADVQLLQGAADRVALAVDRARLYAAEQDARRQAKAALARAQASETEATERAERLRTILETMADGVAVYDADGRPVQLVNRAYRELYAVERGPEGYETLPTFERARLLHLRDAATGAPLPFESTPAGRALRGETITGPSADIRVQAFDGRELEVNCSAAPLHDGDGRVTGAVLVLRDMTERNRLAREREAARVQAERQADQLDRIFEAAADGLIVYDAEGRMVRANAAAYRILGMDAAPPDFDQLPLPERLDPYAARDEQGRPIPPEEWPIVCVLRGEGEPGSGAETRDVRMRALDGREIEVIFSTAPLRDRESHLVGAVNVLHDQTERKRLEMSLRESERLFRTTFEHAAVGIAHVSPDGRWLRFNQRLCDIVGYKREELAALTFQDITHPDDLDATVAHFQRMVAGELDEYQLDKRYIRKDGVPVWIHLTASLVRTPEGEPDYVIATVQDITWRKRLEQERAYLYAAEQDARRQAEAALERATVSEAQASERAEHLQTILETMADGVGVYDGDGRLIQTNRAGRELLAVDRAPGFEALPFADQVRFVDVRDAITGEPLPPERTPPLRALRGEVVSGLDADFRLRALDGRELEVSASAAPLRDREGRVVGAVSVARDVTWHKQLERERAAALARAQASEARAAERAERLNTILETMADGVGVFDQNGRLIQTNRAGRELLAVDRAPGFDALSFADQNCLFDTRDAASGAPLPPERHLVARALRGEVVTGPSADFRMRAFDGHELELNASAAPLHDGDGRIVGAVVVARDITWRRRLEREREVARANELAAREASRRMEAFLATAAHDLRTPLTAIVGYIALAQRQSERLAAAREADPDLARQVEAVRDRVEAADQSAARLTRLLTLLFDTAAIRADRLELHRAPCDLAALVREQVAALRVAAPGRTIRLHAPAAGRPIPVEVDADRIGQVITNYVTNALKYSPPDRPVDVSVEARMQGKEGREGRARVAVCDRGPGIPKEERARVWELFHRAGVATQGEALGGAQQGGLGLGLYICKAIIRAHGGRVGVKSAVGNGSTFLFTLPLS